MQLQEAIKKTREAKGLSQKEVALACKMDQAHYSRIENGKTDPSFSVVVRIANALGLEVHELLYDRNGVNKEINSLDKSIREKVALIESLNDEEKSTLYTMLDAFIGKRKLKDALANVLHEAG